MKGLLKEWKQRCEEERQICEEVKCIHTDGEFQEQYGITDEQMAVFKQVWNQVFLPFEVVILIVKVAVIVIPLDLLLLLTAKALGLW